MAARDFGENDLMVACAENNIELVQEFIQNGKPSVTDKDTRGRTALHYCSEVTDTTIAEMLIRKKKALVKTKDKKDVQPIHLAVIAGNEDLIGLLLLKGADINSTDQEKHNVIHMAVANGHVDLIDFLADQGAKLNKPDKANVFPLHYAVQMCAEGGKKPTEAPAAEKGKGKKGKGAPVKEAAPANREIEVLKKLLSRDVDGECRDCEQRTPLIWAASYGLKKVCDILLDDGVALETSDQNGMTAVHAATAKNQPEMIQYLVNTRKANVNAIDKSGCTPLFLAVTLGFNKCVDVLFHFNADPNIKDNKGRTVAHWAAAKDSKNMLTEIYQNDGDVWTKNNQGNVPAYEAAVNRHTGMVKYLLELAPDAVEAVNTANEENITLLHVAAVTNNVKLCETLLAFGAKKDCMMNYQGKELSPHEVAHIRKNGEVAQVLETMATGSPVPGMGRAGGGKKKGDGGSKEKKEKKGGKGKKKK